jgi:hypothetical protein
MANLAIAMVALSWICEAWKGAWQVTWNNNKRKLWNILEKVERD